LKLALGTAQFGRKYGISNQTGQPSLDEIGEIIGLARLSGITTLDTAIAYGDSERRLGEVGISGWQVVSKLPPVPANCPDVTIWVADSVKNSLNRLKIEGLYALLLHRPGQLLGEHGEKLYRALRKLQAEGAMKRIGISIYDPAEFSEILGRYDFDIVQAPFSLVDQRLIESGWISRLKMGNIELHARSIFLQGLLLIPAGCRPEKFIRWASLWREFDSKLVDARITAIQACLRYALSFPEVSKVVVGVDSLLHLKEILRSAEGPRPAFSAQMSCTDRELLNPSFWDSL
jgi:aryl-alcohol dehydrogenase-like predicted oxidoreductase